MKSFIDKYSIIIDYINDDGDEYYMAYHPEFGKVSCSATGDSPEDAILLLREVTKEVVDYYESNHLTIPEPGVPFKYCRISNTIGITGTGGGGVVTSDGAYDWGGVGSGRLITVDID